MPDPFYDYNADEEEFEEEDREPEEHYEDGTGWHDVQNDYDSKVYGDDLP